MLCQTIIMIFTICFSHQAALACFPSDIFLLGVNTTIIFLDRCFDHPTILHAPCFDPIKCFFCLGSLVFCFGFDWLFGYFFWNLFLLFFRYIFWSFSIFWISTLLLQLGIGDWIFLSGHFRFNFFVFFYIIARFFFIMLFNLVFFFSFDLAIFWLNGHLFICLGLILNFFGNWWLDLSFLILFDFIFLVFDFLMSLNLLVFVISLLMIRFFFLCIRFLYTLFDLSLILSLRIFWLFFSFLLINLLRLNFTLIFLSLNFHSCWFNMLLIVCFWFVFLYFRLLLNRSISCQRLFRL